MPSLRSWMLRRARRRPPLDGPPSTLGEEVLELNLGIVRRDVWQVDGERLPLRLKPRGGADRFESERVFTQIGPRVPDDPGPVEGRRPRDEEGPVLQERRAPRREALHRRLGSRPFTLRLLEGTGTGDDGGAEGTDQRFEPIDQALLLRADGRAELGHRVCPDHGTARLDVDHDPELGVRGHSSECTPSPVAMTFFFGTVIAATRGGIRRFGRWRPRPGRTSGRPPRGSPGPR